MKKFCILLIRFYQLFLSPLLGCNCNFLPTCSHYSALAISKHGVIKGIWLTIIRLIKCNPLAKEIKYDPVPVDESVK